MERMFRKTVNAFLILGMALVVGYAVYAVGIPLSFYEIRTATVRCPTTRTTIIGFRDGNFRINSAEPRCNYAAARVPEPVRGGDNLSFLDLKNEVWENDSLNCEVSWKEYPRLPFALKPPPGDAQLNRSSCRLSSQT